LKTGTILAFLATPAAGESDPAAPENAAATIPKVSFTENVPQNSYAQSWCRPCLNEKVKTQVRFQLDFAALVVHGPDAGPLWQPLCYATIALRHQCSFRLTHSGFVLDDGKGWTLNASLTTLSSYRKCSKRRTLDHSAQATSRPQIEGTTR
jgi:hypothetical protein